MAIHRRNQRVSPSAAGRSPFRAAGRPVAWSALISAAVLTIAVGPVQAAPADDPRSQIPNAGSDPVPAGPVQLPGSAAPVTAPQLSPFAQRIIAEQTRLQQEGEQVKQVKQEHETARTSLALADAAWRAASEVLKQAEERADADAAEAYKAAAELPANLGSDLRNLGALSAVPDDDPPGFGGVRDLFHAQQAEREKYRAYTEAIKNEQALASQYLAKQDAYRQLEAAYLALRQQNADQLATIEREREAREQSLGSQFLGNGALNGFAAHPRAMAAVQMALKQLGKPYVWGAEGPNTFDCSGLMWYSYLYGPNPGYSLPRVSRDQYNATRSRTVSRYALLPGDLIFFATNPNDWTTIHHVGIYLGNLKMIHAPNTGDVVKISTVWWSEFFAATRVIGEVVAPVGGGNGSTPPSSGGNGSTPPSSGGNGSTPPSSGGGTNPSPSQTTKPPATGSPSPSQTASPSPSNTASPTPTETKTPSPTPTTKSPSPSATSTSPSTEPNEGESSAPADPPSEDTGEDTSGSPPSEDTSTSAPSADTSTSAPSADTSTSAPSADAAASSPAGS